MVEVKKLKVLVHHKNGAKACTVKNTGNGYIAKFHAYTSAQQDFYVCLDYSQASELFEGLKASLVRDDGIESCVQGHPGGL